MVSGQFDGRNRSRKMFAIRDWMVQSVVFGVCLGQYGPYPDNGLVWPPMPGVFSSVSAIGVVAAQTTGMVGPNGQTYICVTPGSCTTNGGGTGGGIDPRIVTPGNSAVTGCANGLVPCFGVATQCGRRFITPTSNADGIADVGAYPWQAYLQNSTHSFAGSGVLLDEFHVLTAAHKVANSESAPTTVRVLMGVSNPTSVSSAQVANVRSITLHPQYNAATLRNDLAVLRLATPIVLGVNNNINTACLPSAGTSYTGQRCVVSGWGQSAFTTFDAPTNPMKQVFVNIVTYATCRASYAQANLLGANVDTYLDATNEICAGGESMRDACSQDGGSPLVCPNAAGNYNVAGLVIWGKNCGQPGVYGVYVNVPGYINWIQTTVATT